jgi:cytoskeletal protein CcmA (bactofilin family)
MFRFGKSPDKFETILGPHASLDGHLKCEGSVRIEGEAKGSVTTTGNIIVGKTASVAADLQGCDVLVSGRVEGRIVAQGQLAILASGQVHGDVEVGSILIEEGGVLNGKSTIRES